MVGTGWRTTMSVVADQLTGNGDNFNSYLVWEVHISRALSTCSGGHLPLK